MAKKELKQRISRKQNGRCALSGKVLAGEMSLVDTDRINPKANGGIYVDKNTRIVDPVEHMKRHGTLRNRDDWHKNLKILIDAREQIMKQKLGAENRIKAMKRRTDDMDEETLNFLLESITALKKQLYKIDKRIEKHLSKGAPEIAQKALQIKAVGKISVAYLLVYLEIEKARYASSIWAYCGYDKPSHKRYEKGVSGGGNKTLRTVLFSMAGSFIKHKNIYSEVYNRAKQDYSVSEKMTKSNNTQGKLIECMWKDTKPNHRHFAAMRKMIKHFLADLWYVWRTLEGLETPCLYPEAKLGHTGIVTPKERGWKF